MREIEDITWPRGNFSSSVEKYFTSELRERVKSFQHEKRNFVSPSDHVIYSIYYRNTNKILNHSRKASEGAIFVCNHSNSDLFTSENNILSSSVTHSAGESTTF